MGDLVEESGPTHIVSHKTKGTFYFIFREEQTTKVSPNRLQSKALFGYLDFVANIRPIEQFRPSLADAMQKQVRFEL